VGVSERVITHSSHGEMHDVRLVDDRRDGLDLSTELLLDLVQVEAVVVGDEIDGQAQVAEAARATDAMQVGLGVLGKVKIDDDVHGLNVDTSGEEVCAIPRASRSVTGERAALSLSRVRRHVPEHTKFLHKPLRKSWKTRLRCDWSILAWM